MDGFRINTLQVAVGIASLLLGTLMYLSDRNPQATYFVKEYLTGISLHETVPDLFGILDRSVASFLHVFSFILITAGLTAETKTGCIAVSAVWLTVDALFEMGQYFDTLAVSLVPEWFKDYPFLETTGDFFMKGCFDPVDMAAIFAGAGVALFFLLATIRTPGKE